MTTVEKIQAHLAAVSTYDTSFGKRRDIAKRITCADGTTLSVQVGDGLYCAPRDNHGPWYQVEVGYPDKPMPEIADYAEEADSPTDTVYGYVPIELVAAAIDACGGVAE